MTETSKTSTTARMRLYHTTDAATAILRDGFRDSDASCLYTGEFTGVFVSAYPVDCNEGAKGDEVLEITVPEGFDVSAFAVVEESLDGSERIVWEWLIPSEILNGWPVRLLTEDELEDLAVEKYAAERQS